MYDSILASRSGLAFALIVLAGSASCSSAQIKPPKVLDQPAMVISHLSLDELVVRGIYLRQRGGKKYLYLVTSGKPGIMLVNVTKAKKPFVMKEVDLPKDVRVESLDLIGDGLALMETSNEQSAPTLPRTFNVLDISHPEHPQVIQSFAGVTAIAVSFDYNLLFFANNEGLWILRQQWMQPPVYPCGSSDALVAIPNCEWNGNRQRSRLQIHQGFREHLWTKAKTGGRGGKFQAPSCARHAYKCRRSALLSPLGGGS